MIFSICERITLSPSRSVVPLEGQSCNKNNYLATKFMHDFANELKL